jgi:2-dehydro-3-deoxyphosphooctonate aldolase (KDO 8-P synthase)
MVMVKVKHIVFGDNSPLVLIAGPCVIESEKIVFQTAEKVKKLTEKHKIPFIFKSSYAKANRLSIDSYAGPGIKKGLEILKKVKEKFDLPILTDVHSKEEVKAVAEVADILQIPALLSRQTDLILEVAKTKKVINLKKGQFLAPEDLKPITQKAESVGNNQILLTERGTTFGYHNLVVDMRSLVIMRNLGYPVIFDVTHSLQLPGGNKSFSGGSPEFILPLARSAVACGIDGLFLETHPHVSKALCDGANMLPLDKLEKLLIQVKEIDELVKAEFRKEVKKVKK